MILIFDTETSDKAEFKKPFTDEKQPHIAQLAAILFDEKGEVTNSLNLLIKPDGWSMGKEASDINRLTNERLNAQGVPLIVAMDCFSHLCKNAKVLSAFNINFDYLVCNSAYHRLQKPHSFAHLKQECVMEAFTNICKLPGKFGNYKWPKLTEAFNHVYKRSFEGAHDALTDVKATGQLYFHLKGIEIKLI